MYRHPVIFPVGEGCLCFHGHMLPVWASINILYNYISLIKATSDIALNAGQTLTIEGLVSTAVTDDDTLTGSAFGDEIFGGDGFDFINGGFGSDRVNGGAGGDRLFHLGIADHGSDWIQDFSNAEGDVLVVDTTLFADHPSANGSGVPSGARKHLVERYALSEDGTRLIVDFVMEDPEFMIEPFSARKELLFAPQLELLTYDCDPDLSRQSGFE